ncbi:MAG TPA: DUF481 domain-containing protein [Steroidobacter sp.]|jgi:putative salt-induced outer membrane protein YdiY|nr:DUF481 domain-containing protein [Steroidobacter sp.]
MQRTLLAWLLGAVSASAAADDIVVLNSGNRMSGSIVALSRGELTFSVEGARARPRPGAGRIDIDWQNVAELRSEDTFYVWLASGERHIGSLAATNGRMVVHTPEGPREVALLEVVEIEPASAADFAGRLSGSIDVGFEFLSANDEIDWTLNAEAQHRTTNYRTTASINSLLRRRDGTTAHRRNRLKLDSRRLLDNRWFAQAMSIAEEDRELDLDSRFLLGASYGRTFVRSQRMEFAAFAGVNADRERFRGHRADTLFEAHAGVDWEWFELAADTSIALDAITYFAPDQPRLRVDLEAALRHDISDDYYLSLYVFESYNSDPPEALEKSDLGVALTFGRSF